MMDIQEAYKVMQAECGIKVGDRVKIVRKFKENEMGYNGHFWGTVGNVSTVIMLQENDGIKLADEHGYFKHWAPFFVLELIEKAKKPEPEKMVDIDGKQISVSTIKQALQDLWK